MKQNEITLETEITNALLRFSYGKLTVSQAEELAKKAAKNWDSSNTALEHKGVNWFAKQLISKL